MRGSSELCAAMLPGVPTDAQSILKLHRYRQCRDHTKAVDALSYLQREEARLTL